MKTEGWEYVDMANVDTYVEGTSRCLGIGAKPGYNVQGNTELFQFGLLQDGARYERWQI